MGVGRRPMVAKALAIAASSDRMGDGSRYADLDWGRLSRANSPSSTRTPMSTRFFLLAVLLVTWLSCPSSAWSQATVCDNLDSVPRRFDIDYETDIQPIFDARCANCHVASAGNPEAGLNLDQGISWFTLVDVPSSQNSHLVRVTAYAPGASLLFDKINCDPPTLGERMPFERTPIPITMQALIHDWIELGAWPMTSDTLFFNGFENR